MDNNIYNFKYNINLNIKIIKLSYKYIYIIELKEIKRNNLDHLKVAIIKIKPKLILIIIHQNIYKFKLINLSNPIEIMNLANNFVKHIH